MRVSSLIKEIPFLSIKSRLIIMLKYVVLMLSVLSISAAAIEIQLPEVTEENCKHENIKQLPEHIQHEFSALCLRRGQFVPSEPKAW